MSCEPGSSRLQNLDKRITGVKMTCCIPPFLQMKRLRPSGEGPRALQCQHVLLPEAPRVPGQEVRSRESGGMQLHSG